MSPVQPDTATVKSAERTVRILEVLAASPTRLTVADLQARLGYPRSSLHALVRTLRELRWLEADSTGSAFGVGPHALLSGTAYLDRDPALPFAAAALEDLRAATGWTSHFARRDEAYVLYLASREARGSVRTAARVGRRLPAHATALGQALLAELTPAEVERLLPQRLAALTPNTVTDRAGLTGRLARARARGWAVEYQQGTAGVACVAAAVRYRIPATDALSCSLPAEAATGSEIERVADAVAAHATALADVLRRHGIR